MIMREIESERERQRTLRTEGARGWITLIVLAACVLLNISLFFFNDKHPPLFITASYFLFMCYFLTLLLPLDNQYRRFTGGEVVRILNNLHEFGIIRNTDRFSRVFINAFLINCRTLFIGFALLFSLDILFAVVKYYTGSLPLQTTEIVIFQSAAIIIFYFLVWKLEPYTTEFFADITGMKQRLVTRRIPQRVVTTLLWLLAALAIIAIFSTVIMLPGITVQSVLMVDDVQQVSDLFVHIGVLFASQYFIMRYIHGITSLTMATQFSEAKARYLSDQIASENAPEIPEISDIVGQPLSVSPSAILREKTAIFFESRIYQIERRTIWGTFPVWIINPDFSKIFDKGSLDAILGPYPIAKTPPSGGTDTPD
ncbi:MAG: hypothetical protein NTZ39_04805 [Methanoregula sp.]|nr:hypothetical protein [Methanoregula sp.]